MHRVLLKLTFSSIEDDAFFLPSHSMRLLGEDSDVHVELAGKDCKLRVQTYFFPPYLNYPFIVSFYFSG